MKKVKIGEKFYILGKTAVEIDGNYYLNSQVETDNYTKKLQLKNSCSTLFKFSVVLDIEGTYFCV